MLHRKDFHEVLSTVKQPNLKLKSVAVDLQRHRIGTLMEGFELIYLKITGPYLNLVT